MHRRDVDPSLPELVGLQPFEAVDAERDGGAVGDMARGVLVEERVEERQPGLADARGAVDEGHLAEAPCELVGGEMAFDRVRARARAHLDGLAVCESKLEVAHDRAAELERARRAHGTLGPPPVRAREDLFGREVRDVVDAVCGLEPAAAPACTRKEADGQIRSRAREVNRVEVELVELHASLPEPLRMRAPGGDGVVLVEPNRSLDGRPEPLDVGLAEHLPGLTFGREDGNRPVDGSLVLRCEHHLGGFGRPGAPDARLVEVGEELRVGIASEHDPGRALERPCAREGPRRRLGKRRVGRMLDERSPDVVVGVAHVDACGARVVGGARDRANERRVLDERVHEHGLPGLYVRTDAHDQLGVAVEPLLGGQVGQAVALSGVERDVLPVLAEPGDPVERVVALEGERVELEVLLGAQVAIDAAVGAEVAAHRRGQHALLVAAHRRRGDQLVERGVRARAARRPPA